LLPVPGLKSGGLNKVGVEPAVFISLFRSVQKKKRPTAGVAVPVLGRRWGAACLPEKKTIKTVKFLLTFLHTGDIFILSFTKNGMSAQ
jgi:hypothetical protein